MYYWNTETDKLVTENEISLSYALFGEGYTFPEYMNASLHGSIRTMESHVNKLERELSRYIDFLEPEEIQEKKEEIHFLKKMYLEV